MTHTLTAKHDAGQRVCSCGHTEPLTGDHRQNVLAERAHRVGVLVRTWWDD